MPLSRKTFMCVVLHFNVLLSLSLGNPTYPLQFSLCYPRALLSEELGLQLAKINILSLKRGALLKPALFQAFMVNVFLFPSLCLFFLGKLCKGESSSSQS